MGDMISDTVLDRIQKAWRPPAVDPMPTRVRRVVRGHQSDDLLKLTFDRKVSPRGIYQASRNRWIPTVPNGFGLPSGDSCPGMTSFCDSCYASRSENSAGVRELVEHNLRLLQANNRVGMEVLLDEMIDRYQREADHIDLPAEHRIFRIHWDGDFFSTDYAAAWATVIDKYRTISFWAYTRSFVPPVDVVPYFVGVPNLALYLSVDGDNAAAAAEQAARHPGLRLALCAVDYTTGRALSPPGRRPPIVCPENNGRLDLMADGVGACVSCRLCPDERRDILFSTSHREEKAVHVPAPRRRRPVSPLPDFVPFPSSIERPCANPDCTEVIPPHVGRGRPRIYHDDSCRAAVYYRRTVMA